MGVRSFLRRVAARVSRSHRVAAALLISLACGLLAGPGGPITHAQSSLPDGFSDTVVLSGLQTPTVMAFSPDGRVFVGEKSGVIKVFQGLQDANPTVFADLRTSVNDYGDRGLLGLALDPLFPSRPYVYVLYTRDAPPGGTTPTWGQAGVGGDGCPTPPGEEHGCVVSGRLTRLEVDGNVWSGAQRVLVDDWFQQFNSHSVGSLAFAPDGSLYASGGDGANWAFVDYGQAGAPVNPAGDPPGGVGGEMTPPLAEGGALRAQDLRTDGDPVGLSGTVIRVDPSSGEGWPGNPLFSHPDPNARRIVAYGFRNPFRIAVRPGTSEVWVGDVGWRLHEEIDIIPDAGIGAPVNFGWPCYGGNLRQPGYEAAGLRLCEDLYADAGAVTLPHFQYARGEPAVANDGCGHANASLSGLAFYESGGYPSAYEGALFFADYTRGCIWAMLRGTDGTPAADQVQVFAAGASFPVDLKIGPNGDLFYVDIVGGTVRRIEHSINQPPAARINALPTSGSAPVLVSVDALSSSDPEGSVLTYDWDLDGDGTFGDAAEPSASYLFTTDGTYHIRVRVTDAAGFQDSATVAIVVGNTPPIATIDEPAPALRWRAGTAYRFSGHAADGEEGELTANALSWSVIMNHCSSPVSCHQHPIESFFGVSAGTFVAPDHEYPSYLTLQLNAIDGGGLQHRVERHLHPEPLTVTLATVPAGLTLGLDADVVSDGSTHMVIAASRHTVSAPSPQVVGGVTYTFSSWSDGGAQTHFATIDSTSTITATFTATSSSLPTIWNAEDIGDVGIAGASSESAGQIVVTAAGADVWGTQDAFRYVYQRLSGDGAITARIASLAGVDEWTKAGVMIRASADADAPHAFMLISSAHGGAFQRRPVAGGVTAHTSGPGSTPAWVRLERSGSLVTASVSEDRASWVVVGSDTVPLPEDVLIGVAVTSHERLQLATAVFDSVQIGQPATPHHMWEDVDIGAVGYAGSMMQQEGSLVVTGGGADVWGTSDSFHFTYQRVSGDIDITARVSGVSSGDPWAKVGLMIRESLQEDSPHAFSLVSNARGIAFQRRRTSGESSLHTAGANDAAPAWLRLVREGSLFTAFTSADGSAWIPFASDWIDMDADVFVGLAVTSHDATAAVTGTFDQVSVNQSTTNEWQSLDIGDVGPSGSAGFGADTVAITGAGADIWGAADAFHFVFKRLDGDGEISGRIAALDGPHRWTKLGVMIRESLAPESAHAFMLMSAGQGAAFQRRVMAAASSTSTPGHANGVPNWVRLVRVGSVMSAYTAHDGQTWELVGEDIVPMADSVYVGVAITSHDVSSTAVGTVDSIVIVP